MKWMKQDQFTLLISSGYADSGPGHWQLAWAAAFPNSIKVIQEDWINPNRDAWVQALDASISSATLPVVLVGHSLGSTAIVHWASSNQGKESIGIIKGAFLVALPDPASVAYRALAIKGFDPLPLNKLPFPSMLVTSSNDPFVSLEKARYFASRLGSEFINVGKKGHIGSDSDVGEWNEGKELLRKLYE
jgi:predicted alpha/beta hydrolase family esterase